MACGWTGWRCFTSGVGHYICRSQVCLLFTLFRLLFEGKTRNNPNVTSTIAARNVKYLVPSLLLLGLYWGGATRILMSGDHSIVSSLINLTQVSSNKLWNKVYR